MRIAQTCAPSRPWESRPRLFRQALLESPVDLAVRRDGAAIDGQVGAVDEASLGARKEGDRGRYLFGLRGPSERHALDRLIPDLLVRRTRVEQHGRHVGDRQPRTYPVHADAGPAELEGQTVREIVHPSLASVRPPRTAAAPPLQKRRPAAAPMPEPAPVTTTPFPLNRREFMLFSFERWP